MDDDFIISRRHGGWQIVAVSERGKAFAAADPRFVRDETVVKPAEALFLYHEFHERGYYSRTPDGLPPAGPALILSRLSLLLALITYPC